MHRSLLGSVSILAAACGAALTTARAPARLDTQWSAQVDRGGGVYAAHCARCHGDAGEGTGRAPALVGAAALPKQPRPGQQRTALFGSALDVAIFATQNMPPKAEQRRELSEPDYWAVLAYALHANGVQLTEALGPSNAGKVILHP